MNLKWITALGLLFLVGCGTGYGIYHRVRAGENFDQICAAYGVDRSHIARVNGMTASSKVKPGDAIWIPGADRQIRVGRSGGSTSAASSYRARRDDSGVEKSGKGTTKKVPFIWPVKGNVISKFGQISGEVHDGIDINAAIGTDIRAAAGGRVIYSGDDIEGYGKMIIIKHEGNYSSVYAHNEKNLVQKGAFVKPGDVIATVGSSGRTGRPALHFEIREGKRAVNPMPYLP